MRFFFKNITNRKRWTKVFIIVLFSITITFLVLNYIFRVRGPASASWFDDSFKFRQTLSISNTSGSVLTDYQVSFALNTASLISASKMQSDCDDIRITDHTGSPLVHWIDENSEVCNSASTRIWIKHPSIPTSGAFIYLYYGNTGFVRNVNPIALFDFFDNFSDGVFNNFVSGGGTITESSGVVTFINNADAWDTFAYVNSTYSRPSVMQLRVRANSGTRSMVGWHDSGTGASYVDLVYGLYFANGALLVYEDGFDRGSVGTYVLGTWYDVKIELLATGARYFIKASSVTTWTLLYTSSFSTETNLRPGVAHYDATAGETTTIDDFIIRKYASTEPTITVAVAEEVGQTPVAYWKFDEGYGTTTQDAARTNNGTISGALWQPEDLCVDGKCLYFDGVDDSVSMGTPVDLQITGNQTISMWLKPNNFSLRRNPLAKAYAGEGTITQEVDGTLSYYYGTGGGNNTPYQEFRSITPLELNKWNHVVLVRNLSTSTLRWYINGRQVASTAASYASATAGSSIFYIGTGYTASYAGFIDEVKVFSRALSESDIKTNYLKGSSEVGSNVSFAQQNTDPFSNGLIGYWRMDESSWNGTAGEVKDRSGNNINGTFVNGSTVVGGRFGNAGNFVPGTNNYVNLGSNMSIANNSFTLAGWVRRSTSGRWDLIWSASSGSTNRSLHVGFNSSNFLVCNFYENDLQGSLTVTDTNWHHFACTFDSTTKTRALYLDGAPAGSDIASANYQGTGNIKIGGNYTSDSNAYSGNIDEVRIYNRALSRQEINSLYNFTPAPVLYYNFNENTGTTANDSSGNGNAGTLTNGPTWVNGSQSGGLRFDGVDDSVVRADNATIDVTGNITMSAWVYPTASDANATVVTKLNAYYLERHSDGKIQAYFYGVTTPGYHQSTGTIPNNQWSYISVTYDGANIRFYINGVLDRTIAAAGSITNSTGSLFVGSLEPGNDGYEFTGSIDEVRVYNYARTQEQIVSDMNSGHPAPGSPVGSAVANWKFDEGYGDTAANSGNAGSVLNGNLSGTCPGAATCPIWSMSGKNGRAMSFDGVDDFIDVPDAQSIDFTGDMTISMWVQPRGTQKSNADIISKHSNGGYMIEQNLNSTNQYYFAWDTTGAGAYTGQAALTTLAANVWQHFVVVKSGATITHYLNGVQTAQATGSSATISVNAQPLRIGNWASTSGRQWNGLLDDLKMYNLALSADQVKVEYNQGKSQVLGALGTESSGTTPSFSASREYCVPGDTSSCNPPVAEWKFDENAGTTANDTTGNSNTGTLTNGPTFANGKFGSAVKFDGVDDFVTANDAASLEPLGPFTISAWVFLRQTPSGFVKIVGKWNETGNQRSYVLAINSTNILGYVDNVGSWGPGQAVSSTEYLALQSWNYVTFTYDGANLRLYRNGSPVASPVAYSGTVFNSSAKMMIGGSGGEPFGGQNNYLNGDIDQVRIYNYARTPQQIAWEYNKGSPVAHYKFDECQGSTVFNSAVNANGEAAGNNGAITIGALGSNTAIGTCQTTGARADGKNGRENFAMDFDGTDDFIDGFSIPAQTGANNITVSGWIRPTANQYSRFFTPFANGVDNWIGYNTNGSLEVFYTEIADVNNRSLSSTAGSIPLNTWTHFTVSINNKTVKIYINGILNAQITEAVNIGNWSGAFAIGRRGNVAQNYHAGLIDDVKIFNFELTQAQVRDVFSGSAVVFR